MLEEKPQLSQEDGVWVIRIPRPSGKVQEFRCTTESQAKQMLTVLTPREQRAAAR